MIVHYPPVFFQGIEERLASPGRVVWVVEFLARFEDADDVDPAVRLLLQASVGLTVPRAWSEFTEPYFLNSGVFPQRATVPIVESRKVLRDGEFHRIT